MDRTIAPRSYWIYNPHNLCKIYTIVTTILVGEIPIRARTINCVWPFSDRSAKATMAMAKQPHPSTIVAAQVIGTQLSIGPSNPPTDQWRWCNRGQEVMQVVASRLPTALVPSFVAVLSTWRLSSHFGERVRHNYQNHA